jgi:hypothetical protein
LVLRSRSARQLQRPPLRHTRDPLMNRRPFRSSAFETDDIDVGNLETEERAVRIR